MPNDFELPHPNELENYFKLKDKIKQYGKDDVFASLGLSISMSLCTNGIQENVHVIKSVFTILEIDPSHVLYGFMVGFLISEILRLEETENVEEILNNIIETTKDNFENTLKSLEDDNDEPDDDSVMKNEAASNVFNDFIERYNKNDGNKESGDNI